MGHGDRNVTGPDKAEISSAGHFRRRRYPLRWRWPRVTVRDRALTGSGAASTQAAATCTARTSAIRTPQWRHVRLLRRGPGPLRADAPTEPVASCRSARQDPYLREGRMTSDRTDLQGSPGYALPSNGPRTRAHGTRKPCLREAGFRRPEYVPPEGFEPSHLAPEASALSPELWGPGPPGQSGTAFEEVTSPGACVGRARRPLPTPQRNAIPSRR